MDLVCPDYRSEAGPRRRPSPAPQEATRPTRSPVVPGCLRALTIALAMAACGAERGPDEASRSGPFVPRDVILIIADTLRADHLGCYGYARPTSPSIDRLAADGAVFQAVVAASAFTGPSVASIMTGKYPRFNSFGYANKRHLESAEVTIAETFRDAGYSTAAFICNPVLPARFGFDQGFDLYDEELNEREETTRIGLRTAGPATDDALQWLSAVDEGQRIFLYLHYMDPHGPYLPPPDFQRRFSPPPDAMGPEVPPPPKGGAHVGEGHVPSYQAVVEAHYLNEYIGRYDAEIAYMDHQIDRVLDWFREHGRYDDAVILFTADHGEALGEGSFYFCHGHAVTPDQSFVPLILKHPRVRAGTRATTAVSHIDIYPTLTAGIESGATEDRWGDGVNLALLDERAPSDRAVYCDIGNDLAVHLGGEVLLGSVRRGKGKGAGPEDFEDAKLFTDPVDSVHLVQDRLVEKARGYLSRPAVRPKRRPPWARDAEEDRKMDETLNALGYAGDD